MKNKRTRHLITKLLLLAFAVTALAWPITARAADAAAKMLPIAKITASSAYTVNAPKNLTDGILAEANDKNA